MMSMGEGEQKAKIMGSVSENERNDKNAYSLHNMDTQWSGDTDTVHYNLILK